MKAVQPQWAGRIVFPGDIIPFEDESLRESELALMNAYCEATPAFFNDFVAPCLSSIARTAMKFEQKLGAIDLTYSCLARYILAEATGLEGGFVLHDELLLHRGFGFLHFHDDFETAARLYYETVPVPDVAVICKAPATAIFERIKQREVRTNSCVGLNDGALRVAVRKRLVISTIAGEVLAKRGVAVRFLDTGGTIEESATQLNDIICEFYLGEEKGGESCDAAEQLKNRAIKSCASFRRKTGRHHLRTPDVMYCAFTTPNFTVHRHEAQRDAAMRFARFGMDEGVLRGKSVLDLGSNIGAMLFQATNFGIAEGLGIEYDYDKVKLAREIADLSRLDALSFRQGDIDTLDAAELGVFDITFALAIDGHINNYERFYTLLYDVTVGTLYFESNGIGVSNVDELAAVLRRVGFRTVEHLGACDDDIVPTNNVRQLVRAVK